MTGGDLEMRRKKKKSGQKVKRASRREGLIEKKRGYRYRVKEGEEEGSTVSTEKAKAV